MFAMMAICVSIPRVCVTLLLINWSVMPIHSNEENKCPLNMTLFHLQDGSMDCEVCQICPYGHVEIKSCGYRIPPECRLCKKGTYYNPPTNKCIGCTVCLPGQYVQQACALEKDAVCDNCPAGTFSNVNNMQLCSLCSNCSNNVSAIHNCTSTVDTVCQYDNEQSVPIPLVIGIIVIAIIVVSVIIYGIYFFRCHRRNSKEKKDMHITELPLIDKDQEVSVAAHLHELEPSVGLLQQKHILVSEYHGTLYHGVEVAALLHELEPSVGLLQHNNCFSVAFRVGKDCILTTDSVLKGIKKDAKLILTFDEVVSDDSKFFDLVPKPEFSDPVLNVAVLKIKNPQNDELPAPLPLLQDSSMDFNEIGCIDYVGKERKRHFPCFVVNKDRFENEKKKTESNISCEFDDSKIFWTTYKEHGWQGSPGLVRGRDNIFKVACIYTDKVSSYDGGNMMFKGSSLEHVIKELNKKKREKKMVLI